MQMFTFLTSSTAFRKKSEQQLIRETEYLHYIFWYLVAKKAGKI